jgi:hypothetical protein
MSLFDRVLLEKAGGGRFSDTAGQDAFQHTDRSRAGRRNKTKGGEFVGKNKRFPVSGKSWASAAGSLRQAYARGYLTQKVAKAVAAKFNVCPTILPGCPEKRDHGDGGPPEHTTSCKGGECGAKGVEHGKRWPWPFTHKPGKPKWDADWTALGHQKGSSGQKKDKGPKRMLFKGTKGYHKYKAKTAKQALKKTLGKLAKLKKKAI